MSCHFKLHLFFRSLKILELEGCARHHNEPHVVVDVLASYEVLSMVLMQRSRYRCPGHFVLLSDWPDLDLLTRD